MESQMGRLEKQIIVGAIALVAVLLGIVVLTGVKPVDAGSEQHMKSEWMPPEVPLSIGDPSRETLENDSGSSIGLGGAELSLGSEPKQLSTEAQEKSETLTSPPASQEEPQGSGELATLDAVDQLHRYQVKKGETLGEIAMRELGSVKDLDLILEINEGMRADRVRAGDEIWLPSKAAADQRRSEKKLQAKANDKLASAANSEKVGRYTHEVGTGDSLWRIAERYYGREGANEGVKRLVAANSKLTDVNTVLRLGWVLTIPE
ncbi:MAG: LysM domain-containing protein [Planctomycetes bacterium]|nr:LysM domain-containing protein [Planctomycetota bacterium]